MTQLKLGFATGGTGSNDQFALQKSRTADVRFGSGTDITVGPINVRYSPKSGHRLSVSPTMLTVHGASQQIWMTDVRFGSKADIHPHSADVRFPPKSRHSLPRPARPLCAKSRHSALRKASRYSITSSTVASGVDGISAGSRFLNVRLRKFKFT
jgi:hypothetical protein